MPINGVMKRFLIIVLSTLFITNPLFAHDSTKHMDGMEHEVAISVVGSDLSTCQEQCGGDDLRVCCAKAAVHCSNAFSCSTAVLGLTPNGSINVFRTAFEDAQVGLVFEAETPPPRI